jgi:cellulose synthase/poly-beta-1,6-N-acetylglucosamine synthase-like glycosyltransferase
MKASVIAEIVSWFCLLWVLNIYFFYPIFLWIIHLIWRHPVKKAPYEPAISFIVSAYNEESVIAEKLENILSLDYPKEKLEIVIASDASTDRTDEIVKSYSDKGVRLFRLENRGGKIPALNAVIPTTGGEILVLSDANAMYNPEALRALMSNFVDKRVGAVNGEHIFLNKSESTVERGVGFYWKYETWLKVMESAIYTNVFITGAMIALRRELYPKGVSGELNLDNVLPTCIVNQGMRVVYESGAVVTEETAKNAREDFGGRVRTTIRGFCFVSSLSRFIDIWKHPIFVFHLLCRKVFRWLVAPFLIVLFFGNLMLVGSPHYRVCFYIQIGFYLSAVIGWILNKHLIKFKFFSIIYYFCLINIAALIGFLRFLTGEKMSTWSHATRR